MTKDLETARQEAQAEANRTLVAYLYKLRSGYYYVSPHPPSMVNAEFVEAFKAK